MKNVKGLTSTFRNNLFLLDTLSQPVSDRFKGLHPLTKITNQFMATFKNMFNYISKPLHNPIDLFLVSKNFT